LTDQEFQQAATNEYSKAPQYEDELNQLAALPPIEYDLERDKSADRLGCRIGTLDREVARRRDDGGGAEERGGSTLQIVDPEPWHSPVDGAALLSELAQWVRRHVMMSAAAADAVALWIAHSHSHGSAAISPILAITSPAPECGKTTTVGLLGALVPRPLPASNITPAALFRSVEKWAPTLLIDEADTFLKGSDDLKGILNSGHSRTSAFVVRTVGDDHDPRTFGTWGPKTIALIGQLPATLASRSIHIELRRLAPDETVEPFRADRPPADFDRLRQQAWRWAKDHLDELSESEPHVPGGLRGRAADNWRHLLAIADAAGGEWPVRARAAAETLAGSRAEGDDDAVTTALLADLRDLFEKRGEDRLASSVIVKHLGAMEERPWSEWKQGKQMSARQLAALLKPFKVEPRSIRLSDNKTAKGYLLKDLRDAFERYLPCQTGTTSQALTITDLAGNPSVTAGSGVTDGKAAKRLKTNSCDAVPGRMGATITEVL